jgi:hypothetical protein
MHHTVHHVEGRRFLENAPGISVKKIKLSRVNRRLLLVSGAQCCTRSGNFKEGLQRRTLLDSINGLSSAALVEMLQHLQVFFRRPYEKKSLMIEMCKRYNFATHRMESS